ncbi:methylglyoxal synthase [Streptomyces sp. TBY4]|uniref:methylglyoxal synthase n=1 Tax=Streptomyces sp. TBY4 TaxID=2962030 RepID=UPI0020B67FF0|nr:methylglyoxal synthase [Streptomyces sp. TBY4]MCP3754377.1 methylglyoxal synthase [Streptomyces sp. TBY4]
MIALVAHDQRKNDLLNWVRRNRRAVTRHGLVGTSSTARLLRSELGLQIRSVESGPHGGDQQIDSMVISGDVTSLVFFWDPLWAAPHVHDVLALVRIAVLRNIPVALNPASAEAMSEDGFSLENQPATAATMAAAAPVAAGVRSDGL